MAFAFVKPQGFHNSPCTLNEYNSNQVGLGPAGFECDGSLKEVIAMRGKAMAGGLKGMK